MTASNDGNLLCLKDISQYYTSGQSVVMGLNGISLSFRKGEFVAITGESGSGKSTLAKVMAGILSYEDGEMIVDGKPTSHYGHSDWERYRCGAVSFISQSYDILPGCTVLKNVVSALVLTGMDRRRAVEKAEEILRQVELYDEKNRRAAKLSSGQKQRLSIARALAKPAPVLIADEPTGNLDSENSAKVISLLSAAAGERLVIMITHDFEEAEESVTRHITVRDGTIASDVMLRPARACEAEPEREKVSRNTGGLSFYTAALQIGSRPVWTAVTLFFFTLTAFAMFAFAGTFVVNLDDAFTRYYDNTAFVNGSDTRILVVKEKPEQGTVPSEQEDLEQLLTSSVVNVMEPEQGTVPLEQEDLERLLAVEHVELVEPYGCLSDINYYYRQDIDYRLHYSRPEDEMGGLENVLKETVTFPGNSLFMQTVPCLPEDSVFLTAGRLPETIYEVVAFGGEDLIGTTIPVYLRDSKNWGEDQYIKMNVTVTGVTDRGSGLYFSEEMGRSVIRYFRGDGKIFMPFEEGRFRLSEVELDEIFLYSDLDYFANMSMEGRTVISSLAAKSVWEEVYRNLRNMSGEISIWQLFHEREFYFDVPGRFSQLFLKVYGQADDVTFRHFYMVEQEEFELLTDLGGSDMAALTISDYAYTDRVLEAVRALGYTAISPYQAGSTKQNEALAAERLQTLKICILAFLAVFLLQVLVLRAMFGMETGEFRLLANLGLGCRTARWSVVWQMLGFTVAGQALAAAVVCCFGAAGVERIAHILKYLSAPYILLFALIHLTTGMLTSLWVQNAVTRQVYPYSLQETDLKTEDA